MNDLIHQELFLPHWCNCLWNSKAKGRVLFFQVTDLDSIA